MLEGGRLIGQGRFGCVFDTLPTCSSRARTVRTGRYVKNRTVAGRGTTKRVAKLMALDDPTVPIEIETSRQIRKIPHYADYFIVIEDFCEGDDITGDADWEECRLFSPDHRKMPTFMQLRMANGGVKLSDFSRNINAILAIWLPLQIHVFEGLRMMHTRRIVHGDLHAGNILVDNSGVARIVDFGLSYNLDRLKEKDTVSLTFMPTYDNYPPEMDLLAALKKGIDVRQAIEIIYTEKRILTEIEELFPNRYTVVQDLANFAQRFEIKTGADVKQFIQTFGKATDIWTLGYNFLRIYLIMISTPVVVESDFYKQHHRDQMRLLAGLLAVDPRRRFRVDDALTQLYSMRMD
jgi:serine/threonine protein kinase